MRSEFYAFEVDMWTLGCILGELALNEPMFDGESEIEQLFKMFSILGVDESYDRIQPDLINIFPKWQAIHISDIADKKSQKFKELCNIMIPSRELAFQKLLKLNSVLGPEGMNMLELLLQINPHKRPTPNLLLSHPFIKDLNQENTPSQFTYQHNILPSYTLCNIWNMLIDNERKYKAKKDYMNSQTSITSTMRSILVDWLINVGINFDLSEETVHLAVAYLDRVLSERVIDKTKLQLLGVTCMKIADVFNERSKEYYRQENTKEYVYITAGEYNEQELLLAEKELLMLMKFQLYSPSTIHFLKIYFKVLDIDANTQILCNVIFMINNSI